jgi:hypothetical protein
MSLARRYRIEALRRAKTEGRTARAESVVDTIIANLDNTKLTDKEFRQFCRNSLNDIEDYRLVSDDEEMLLYSDATKELVGEECYKENA